MTTAVFANQPGKGGSQSFEVQQEVYGTEPTVDRQTEAMSDEGDVVTPGDGDEETTEQADTEERDTYESPPTAKLYKKSDNGLMNWPEAERRDSWKEARLHSDLQEMLDNDEGTAAPEGSIGKTTADENELDAFNEEHLTLDDRSVDENEFLDESTLENVDMPEEDMNEGTEENGSQEQSSFIEDVFDQEEQSDRQLRFGDEVAEEPSVYMDVKLEYRAKSGAESEAVAEVPSESNEESPTPSAEEAAAERSDAKPKDEVPFMDIKTHYEGEITSDLAGEEPAQESEETVSKETEGTRKASIVTSDQGEPLEQPSLSIQDSIPDEREVTKEDSSLNEQSAQEEQKTVTDEDTMVEEGSLTTTDIQEEEEDEDKFHDYDALSMKKTVTEKQLTGQQEPEGVLEEEEPEEPEEPTLSQETKEELEEARRESIQEAAETREQGEEVNVVEEGAPSVEEAPLRRPSETTSASEVAAKKISDATFAAPEDVDESNVAAEDEFAASSRKGSDVQSVKTMPEQESLESLSEVSNMSGAGSKGFEEGSIGPMAQEATGGVPPRKMPEKKTSEPVITPLSPERIGPKKFSLPTEQLPEVRSASSSRRSSDATPVATPPRRESLRSQSKLGSTSELGEMEEISEQDVEMSAEYSLPARTIFARKASEPVTSSMMRGHQMAKRLSQSDHAKSVDLPSGKVSVASSRKGSNASQAETPLRRESLRRQSNLSAASDLEGREMEELTEQAVEASAVFGQPAQEAMDRKTSEAKSAPPLTPSQRSSKRPSLVSEAEPGEVPVEEREALGSRKSSTAVPAEAPSRKESLRSISKDSTVPEAPVETKEEVQPEQEKVATAAQLELEEVQSPTVEQGQPEVTERAPTQLGKLYKEIPVEEEKLTPSEPSSTRETAEEALVNAEPEVPTAELTQKETEEPEPELSAEEMPIPEVPTKESAEKPVVYAEPETLTAEISEEETEEAEPELGVAELPKPEATPEEPEPSKEETYGEEEEEEESQKVETTAFVPISPKKSTTEAPVKATEAQASTEYRQYYPLYESRTPATMSASSMASSYSSDYSRPYNHYISVFDSHVSTGPFSQSNYFALRRSVSRERMSSSLSRAGSFSRFDSYHDFLPYTASRSTAQIPTRSTSFSRFMDYYDRVKDRLKRTYSRESLYRPKETHATYSYSNVFQPSVMYSSAYQPSVTSPYGYNYNYNYDAPRRNVYGTYSQESVYTPRYRSYSYSYPTRSYGAFNKIYDYYSTIKNRYTQSNLFSPFRRIRSYYRPWKFDNTLF